jgi:hypothetical protein
MLYQALWNDVHDVHEIAEVKALEHRSNILQDAAKLEQKMKEEVAKEEAKAASTSTTAATEEEEEEPVVHRPTLPPPPITNLTADQYFAAGNTTHLGRPISMKGALLYSIIDVHVVCMSSSNNLMSIMLSRGKEEIYSDGLDV